MCVVENGWRHRRYMDGELCGVIANSICLCLGMKHGGTSSFSLIWTLVNYRWTNVEGVPVFRKQFAQSLMCVGGQGGTFLAPWILLSIWDSISIQNGEVLRELLKIKRRKVLLASALVRKSGGIDQRHRERCCCMAILIYVSKWLKVWDFFFSS